MQLAQILGTTKCILQRLSVNVNVSPNGVTGGDGSQIIFYLSTSG